MDPLEPLRPDQRAVVALVLQQGRSYEEIASLLAIPVAAVRARARAGLAALAPDDRLPDEITAPLADYLLGQQPPADAEATRGLLAESAPARTWAEAVAARLGAVAPHGLAEIPGAGAKRAAPQAAQPTEQAAPSEPATERDERPIEEAAQSTRGAERAEHAGRPEAAPSSSGDAAAAPAASRLGGIVLIAAVVAAVGLVLFVVLRGGDGSDEPSASAGSATPAATPTPSATPQVADQIRLAGTSGSRAAGQMTIFLQDGQLLFQLQATGVPANTKRSAYAVWFTNPGGRAHRLGFTSPVGADGKLAIQGPSEKDLADFPKLYATYRTVVVSRETSENARRPGPILLTGRLPKGR
jgi:hypothetical protein